MFLRLLLKGSLRERAKDLSAFAVSIIFAVTALPALAQQQQQQQAAPTVPAPPYGYGHMMWGGPGWGWHPFFIIGPIFALLEDRSHPVSLTGPSSHHLNLVC